MSLSNLFQIKNNYERRINTTTTEYNTVINELQDLTNYNFESTKVDNIQTINDTNNIIFYDNKIKKNPFQRQFMTNVVLSNIVNITPGGAQNFQVSFLQMGNLISGWCWWDFFILPINVSASFDFSLPVDRTNNFTSPLEGWGSVSGMGSVGYGLGYIEAVPGTKTLRCILNSAYQQVGPTTFISQINYYID